MSRMRAKKGATAWELIPIRSEYAVRLRGRSDGWAGMHGRPFEAALARRGYARGGEGGVLEKERPGGADPAAWACGVIEYRWEFRQRKVANQLGLDTMLAYYQPGNNCCRHPLRFIPKVIQFLVICPMIIQA
jgi:hypothetical protein